MAPLPPESTPVDLGLPSGLKWAAANLGAESETDPGLYYQWGDTEGYAEDSGYVFCNSNYESKELYAISADLTRAQDAANVRLGGSWRMPTKTEFEELYNNTNVTWTTINGVAGLKFANKTDASKYIFLPAAGNFNGYDHLNSGKYGYYWTREWENDIHAYSFVFHSGNQNTGSSDRFLGQSVRGVCK